MCVCVCVERKWIAIDKVLTFKHNGLSIEEKEENKEKRIGRSAGRRERKRERKRGKSK